MAIQSVVVTGAAGMLGSALMDLAPAEVNAIGVDLVDGDLSLLAGAREALGPPPDAARGHEPAERHSPGVVIHCAAYTDVDGCTREPARAHQHNAIATGNVAQVCADMGARLLYISTDYVFDGTKGAPYTEDDPPHPLNPYGESKLAGERAVQQLVDNSLVVRTQWMFGPGGKNFVASIINRARQGEGLRVVADEFGSPTYSRDLAGALWRLALTDVQGIIHVTNSGYCSWAQLARYALESARLSDVPITEIPGTEWPSRTQRPQFSVLDNRRWQQLGFTPLRPWQEAVREYVREYLSPS